MRRTLALAGAAVLTVGLGTLAGPASADTGIALQETDALINEVAADLDPMAQDYDGSFVEFIDHRTNPQGDIELDGWTLSVCGSTSGSGLTTVVEFGPDHFVPEDGKFLVGDLTFDNDIDSPSPDAIVPGLNNLERAGGGVQLMDTSSSVDNVEWGDSHADCVNFADARDPSGDPVSPTGSESINRDIANDKWGAFPCHPHSCCESVVDATGAAW